MAWQLETWLRTMVYVELRAARVDWEEPIKRNARDWPPRSKESDKKLHHMATSHQAALSYLTFGQLWNVISDSANWPLFEPYFPPKDNTDVRVEEVKAIRNRVAHFREPHPQDEARFELFMRDLEPGIRGFCERYTLGKIATEPDHDPVSAELEQSWEHVGYGIELLRPNGGWLYAPGIHRRSPLMNAELQLLTHNACNGGSLEGVIYKLTFGHNRKGQFDNRSFVENTRGLHKDIVHILLSAPGFAPAVTIPAIHGVEATTELLGNFLQAALQNNSSHSVRELDRDRLKWPEYILWPDHMLTFFDKDMRESVLDLMSP
ncbi:MAG TPA: hypothetical protein VGN42_12685 [Pirellulales bacterium]|jgi:hypothetical protein|nr:hypothetical protein [Pirellulales bacterium]